MLIEKNEKCIDCRWIYGGELVCVCPSSEHKGQDVSFEDTEHCTQFVHWDELQMIHKGDGELLEKES